MSSVHQVNAERSLFVGARVPTYIKSLHKLLSNINKNLFRQLLKLAVYDLEGHNVHCETYLSIKKSNENCDVDAIYGALHFLIKCALRFPQADLKKEIFKEDLRELRIQEEYIDDLTNVTFGPRCLALSENMMAEIPRLLKLETIHWRVDVAISISSLSRILEPTLLMETVFSNGSRKTFEVSPSLFHRFRFAVATLLKEIENLEKRNIFKL